MAWRPRRLVELFLTTQYAKSFLLNLQGVQALMLTEVKDGNTIFDLVLHDPMSDSRQVDLDTRVLEPLENPFGAKLLPMQPVRSVTDVSGLDPVAGLADQLAYVLWNIYRLPVLRRPKSSRPGTRLAQRRSC
jgi:hypothetical protein